MIDIERLHGVLEGRIKGRQAGHTFARMVQAAQYTDFFPNGCVVYLCASEEQARSMVYTLRHVLKHLGMQDELTHETRDYVKFINGCRIIFLSISNKENFRRKTIGQRIDNFVVDHFAEYLFTESIQQELATCMKKMVD